MNGGDVIFNFKGNTNDIEEDTKGLASKVKGIASGMAKGLGVAAASGATAITGMIGASVKSYADTEQLVGGVETLFAESEAEIKEFEKIYGKSWEELKNAPEGFTTSVDEVLSNAKNAYKTAGVSANEYMSGVTSFAASLLQSVEGNSHEAMEIADMAFTDMADNANKMGSSMESIQNAYQGFAKQNYTLLDNLKLG